MLVIATIERGQNSQIHGRESVVPSYFGLRKTVQSEPGALSVPRVQAPFRGGLGQVGSRGRIGERRLE